MIEDKSSCSILLDVAWEEIDKNDQGFIYAKDFPDLINGIEKLMQKSTDGKDKRLLSDTGNSVILAFAKEKEFFKIYKDEFKDIFYGLIGRSFGEILNKTYTIDKTNMKLLQPRQKSKPYLSAKLETVEDVNLKQADVPMSSRLKSLETQLASVNEELKFKDNVIAEKDREIIQLTHSLSDYKDKYNYLQREFSFYKDRGESNNNSPKRAKTKESQQTNDAVNLTKHEFIISELTRKLQEQTIIINSLREEFRSEGAFGPKHTTKSGKINKSNSYNDTKKPIILVMLCLALFFFFKLWPTGIDENAFAPDRDFNLAWWEKNPLISRIAWLFKEQTNLITNDNEQYYSSSTDAYNQYFGK